MAQQTSTHVAANSAPAPFPPFATETFGTQLIWLALTFGLLYLLISRLVAPRLESILARRRKVIQDDLERAGTLQQEAENAAAAYEASLASAKAKAQSLAQETRAKLTRESEESRKTLEQQLEAKLADAARTIEASRHAAMQHVDAIASEAAVSIVSQLGGISPSAQNAHSAVLATRAA